MKLKYCPLCGEKEPKWLLKEEWKLLGKQYHFKCPACGSILQVSQDDVTGLSFTTNTLAGQMKKYKGKDNKKVYVTVEKISLAVRTPENMALEGAEATLEELMEKGMKSEK